MRVLVKVTAVLCMLFFTHPLLAGTLTEPTGRVLLTVDGKIRATNSRVGADFDLAMLDALPQHQFETTTPWTEGRHRYQGVLLSELLSHLEARGNRLTATALNDYRIAIDLEAIRDYPVIIATRQDGEYMRIRDKGPLWILYPMSDYPELDQLKHHAGMVWQLRRLTVE